MPELNQKTTPCLSCPWRRSNPTDGSGIPNFDIGLMRRLRNTVAQQDGFRTIMACHHSKPGEERACLGYVAVEGHRNLHVRIMGMRGELDLTAIAEATHDMNLFPSFLFMLETYERTLGNPEPAPEPAAVCSLDQAAIDLAKTIPWSIEQCRYAIRNLIDCRVSLADAIRLCRAFSQIPLPANFNTLDDFITELTRDELPGHK